MEEVLTAKEAAIFLKINVYTLYQMLKTGRLQGFRINTHWRVSRVELDRFAGTTQSNKVQVEIDRLIEATRSNKILKGVNTNR